MELRAHLGINQPKGRNRGWGLWEVLGVFLGVFLISEAAPGASYKLTAGEGYTVCEAFKQQLEGRTEDNPLVCKMRLKEDSGGFSRPNWHELSLDKPENLALFRKLDQIVRKNDESPVNGGEDLPKLTKQEWLKDFRHRRKQPDLHPRLLKAKLGLDGKGKDETVVALTWGIERCEKKVAKGQGYTSGYGTYALVMYDEKQDRVNLDLTLGKPLGSATKFDVLEFQGRAFLFATYFSHRGGWSEINIETYNFAAGSSGTLVRCKYEMTWPGKGYE